MVSNCSRLKQQFLTASVKWRWCSTQSTHHNFTSIWRYISAISDWFWLHMFSPSASTIGRDMARCYVWMAYLEKGPGDWQSRCKNSKASASIIGIRRRPWHRQNTSNDDNHIRSSSHYLSLGFQSSPVANKSHPSCNLYIALVWKQSCYLEIHYLVSLNDHNCIQPLVQEPQDHPKKKKVIPPLPWLEPRLKGCNAAPPTTSGE